MQKTRFTSDLCKFSRAGKAIYAPAKFRRAGKAISAPAKFSRAGKAITRACKTESYWDLCARSYTVFTSGEVTSFPAASKLIPPAIRYCHGYLEKLPEDSRKFESFDCILLEGAKPGHDWNIRLF